MSIVAALLVASFALYAGFFFLLARLLDVGTPSDSLRAGIHRTWLGGAATLAALVVHIFLRLGGASPETMELAGHLAVWALRLCLWAVVTSHVYRVTRWRKGKLAAMVVAGLALNAAVDFGLARLGPAWTPSFGSWAFRLC